MYISEVDFPSLELIEEIPIREKIFVLLEVTKNFLHENILPVLTYTANICIWYVLEVDKNIVSNTKIL